MGGSPRQVERCSNKPGYLITELKPGKDGRKGSMTLCDFCKREFVKKTGGMGYKYETLIPDPPPKKLIEDAAKAVDEIPEDELEEHAESLKKPCVVKEHFDCDGTGQMCGACGESEAVCDCPTEEDMEKCKDCNGTGRFCVEHDSGCGDLSKKPRCDAVRGNKNG